MEKRFRYAFQDPRGSRENQSVAGGRAVSCSGHAGVQDKVGPVAEKVAGRVTMSVFEQERRAETASILAASVHAISVQRFKNLSLGLASSSLGLKVSDEAVSLIT